MGSRGTAGINQCLVGPRTMLVILVGLVATLLSAAEVDAAAPVVVRPTEAAPQALESVDGHRPMWAPATSDPAILFDPVGEELFIRSTSFDPVDFTGDGKDDVINAYSGELRVLPGGVAGFGAEITAALPRATSDGSHLETGDVTGDGQPDVVYVVTDFLSVVPGGGGAIILPRADYSTGIPRDLELGDFNGDGRIDVLVADKTGSLVRFYMQQSDGTLALESVTNPPPYGYFFRYAAGDVNGDSLTDLIVWEYSGSMQPVGYLQTSPGVWSDGVVLDFFDDTREEVRTLQVADIDADGVDDIFVVSNVGYISQYARVLWQTSGGIDDAATDLPLECTNGDVVDANGDSLPDLTCRTGVGQALLIQETSRQFEVQRYLMNLDEIWAFEIGDFVGDGNADLIASEVLDARIYEGFDPTYLTAHSGQITGWAASEGTTANGLCISAVSSIDGRLAGWVEQGDAGPYAFEVPPGVYILHHEDCREPAHRPDGESYVAGYLNGLHGRFTQYVVGLDESVVVDFAVPLTHDGLGGVVDNKTGEPLAGIEIFTTSEDPRTGLVWYRASTVSGSDGSFALDGGTSYKDDLHFYDPKGVYPPQKAPAGSSSIQLGWWGLVGPILADIHSSVFVGDILWLLDEGITKGCNPPDNDLYCPKQYVTRGQMAAFLVRFLNLPLVGSVDFVDDNGLIFEDSIVRLADAGITRGCNPPVNDKFCPHSFVTRQQMAAFLVRAFNLPPAGENHFVDDNGSQFEDAIARLAAAGITKGCNPPINDHFCPHDPVTREQMAAFLRRASRFR